LVERLYRLFGDLTDGDPFARMGRTWRDRQSLALRTPTKSGSSTARPERAVRTGRSHSTTLDDLRPGLSVSPAGEVLVSSLNLAALNVDLMLIENFR
jgi:hypothetical protein